MRIPIITISSALLIVSGVLALPNAKHVLHEKRDVIPRKWTRRGPVPREAELPVRIGLTQQNLDKGADWLMEVSEHTSPKYGQHYSAEEVIELFAPSQSAIDAVGDWLHQAGIHPDRVSLSANKQWLQLDAKAEELESLLKTKYHEWHHGPSGTVHVACDEYFVPEHIKHHIDYITPGIKLISMRSSRRSARRDPKAVDKRTSLSKSSAGAMFSLPPIAVPLPLPLDELLALPLTELCGIAITPACYQALYGIPNATKAVEGNDLGIFESLGDVYAQQDLDDFFAVLAENVPGGTYPTLNGIDGATAPNPVLTAGLESDLDFEIALPLIYPQGAKLFQTDDDVYQANYTYDGFLNNILDALDGSYCTYTAFGEKGNSPLDPPYPDPAPGGYKGKLQCGVYKPTNVISISYGGQEADLPPSYQKRQCNEFMKLGMQGISIVVASGDSGVGGPADDDSSNGCLLNGTVFSPDFPATCPYLTTLGATALPPTGNVYNDSETAVDQFSSGGGFSNIYPIPGYQKHAVATFFADHDPTYKYYSTLNAKNVGAGGGIYNRIGRGYPDVSANGENVVIFGMGAPNLVDGTSAAAPLFASILTRINGERLSAKKSRIGFVNPVLYAHPHVLHDITSGNNSACGTNGFESVKGWDPVTGLGTPRYEAMLKLFMSLK